MEEKKSKSSKSRVLNWKYAVVALVVLASLGAAVYFWNDAREAKQQTPEAVAERNQQETQQVVGELSAILLIEGDQQPTVARVEDPSVLQQSNPDFYANVQTGDYLVLYPQRAIIYRSASNQIINIAPIINTDQLNQQTQDQATQDNAEADSQN